MVVFELVLQQLSDRLEFILRLQPPRTAQQRTTRAEEVPDSASVTTLKSSEVREEFRPPDRLIALMPVVRLEVMFVWLAH